MFNCSFSFYFCLLPSRWIKLFDKSNLWILSFKMWIFSWHGIITWGWNLLHTDDTAVSVLRWPGCINNHNYLFTINIQCQIHINQRKQKSAIPHEQCKWGAHLADLVTKIVAMATSLERSQNGSTANQANPYVYQSCKFSEDRSNRYRYYLPRSWTKKG